MVETLLTEIVNRSLPILLEAKESKTTPTSKVARELLPVLQSPVDHDLMSKVFRFLRNVFCTRSWCIYSDVRQNLSHLLHNLQQPEVGYEVRDADRQYALRHVCHGDAKEALGLALKAMHESIKELGLSSQKQQSLSMLVNEIAQRVQNVEFKEDFANFSALSQKIHHEMEKLDSENANLPQIRKALQEIPTLSNHAVDEELKFAFQRLNTKEKVEAFKRELESVSTVDELFLKASHSLDSYRPSKRYVDELLPQFTEGIRTALQAKLSDLTKGFEFSCKRLFANTTDFSELQGVLEGKIQDLMLSDFIHVHEKLQDLKPSVDVGPVFLKAYLKVFKKVIRQDIEKMGENIKSEENLIKLGQYQQLVNGLYTLIDAFEESELLEVIKEKVDELKLQLDGQLQRVDKNAVIAISQPTEQLGDRKIVVLTAQDSTFSGYGVALGALGWVPKFGLPFASIIEMVSGKAVKPSEAAAGSMISLALITSYVALSGQTSSLFSYGTLWAMAPIVAPTLAGHAAGGLPIISWIKPLKIAAGVVAAGATHYALQRGPWVLWDIARHGTPFAFKLLWQSFKGSS